MELMQRAVFGYSFAIVVKEKGDLCIKSGLFVPGKGNERISNENFRMVCTDS